MRRCAMPPSTPRRRRGDHRARSRTWVRPRRPARPDPKVRHGAHAGTGRRRQVAIGKRPALQPQRDAVRHAAAAGRRRGDIDRGHGCGVGGTGNGIELDVSEDAQLDQKDVGLVDVRRRRRRHVDDVGDHLPVETERPRTAHRSWWRRRRCPEQLASLTLQVRRQPDRRNPTGPPRRAAGAGVDLPSVTVPEMGTVTRSASTVCWAMHVRVCTRCAWVSDDKAVAMPSSPALKREIAVRACACATSYCASAVATDASADARTVGSGICSAAVRACANPRSAASSACCCCADTSAPGIETTPLSAASASACWA